MKIGILLTGHAPDELLETFGDYDAFFARLLDENGFSFATYKVVDGEFPDGANAADGWLITGSRHGAYEEHGWIPPLEDLIREIYSAGLPMIGVCFGHQIIAQALGGKVEKFAGGWAVGAVDYDYGGRNVRMNAWHQDQVTRLPDGAKVIGSNAFCENAILAYDDRILTVQPHPEYDGTFIKELIRTRGRGLIPDGQLDAALPGLDQPSDRIDFASDMVDFFKKERA